MWGGHSCPPLLRVKFLDRRLLKYNTVDIPQNDDPTEQRDQEVMIKGGGQGCPPPMDDNINISAPEYFCTEYFCTRGKLSWGKQSCKQASCFATDLCRRSS